MAVKRKTACEVACEVVVRLDKQVNGNGQPGIRQELQALAAESHAFFTEIRASATNEQRFHDKRDEEIKEAALLAASHIKTDLDARHELADLSNKRFQRWMQVAVIVIMLCGVWIAWREYERKIGTATVPAPIAASQPPPVQAGINQAVKQHMR